MLRKLPVLIAIPLVAAYGLAEGIWSNRWQTSNDLNQAVDRMKDVPLHFGEWQGSDQSMNEDELRQFDMAACLVRTYTNRSTYETIRIVLICGTPGPTAVHTPDVCYRGAGYTMKGDAIRYSEAAESAAPLELWTARFEKPKSALAGDLRIYWGWSTNGSWLSPDSPRWYFAGQKFLYKLYVIRAVPQDSKGTQDEVCLQFLHEFLPELNPVLFPAAPPKS